MLNRKRLAEVLLPLNEGLRSSLRSLIERQKIRSIDDIRRVSQSVGNTDDAVDAVWLLARLAGRQDVATTHTLLDLAAHGNAAVRAEAARAFSVRRTEMAVPILSRLVRRHSDEDVRMASAYSLGHMGYPQAADVLRRVLQDQDESSLVRGMAAESLGVLGVRTAPVIAALMKGLADPSPSVVFWAAGSLGALRASAALPLLKRLLGRREVVDGIASIAEEASEAIKMIERGSP